MKTEIMYLEAKSGGLAGAFHGTARIARVRFSKTGKTLYYLNRAFQSLGGSGYKANYFDADTGEHLWISRPRLDGNDALYALVVEVDEDVRTEYWREIRKMPHCEAQRSYRSEGKHRRSGKIGEGKIGAETPGRRALR